MNSYRCGPLHKGGRVADFVEQSGVPALILRGHREGTRPSPTGECQMPKPQCQIKLKAPMRPLPTCDCEEPRCIGATKQSQVGRRLPSPDGIGTRNDESAPQAGAGIVNGPWRPDYEYSAVSGGDLCEQVSSFFSAMVGSRPDLSLSPEGSDPEITSEDGGPMGMTTIAAHGGSPQGGRRSIEGGAQHPQYVRGGAKN